MRRRADGVEQQRREVRRHVVRHGQQALLGHGERLRRSRRRAASRSARWRCSHRWVSPGQAGRRSARTRPGCRPGSAGRAARWPGWSTRADDLVARRHRPALPQRPQVAAAERAGEHAQQHLAAAPARARSIVVDRDAAVAVEAAHVASVIPFTAPNDRPDDQPALNQEGEHERRQRDDRGGGHQRAPVGDALADEVERRDDRRLGARCPTARARTGSSSRRRRRRGSWRPRSARHHHRQRDAQQDLQRRGSRRSARSR